MTLDDIDKTGLIREAYRIEGITAPECRSIFVDWAIKLPSGFAAHEAIAVLVAAYGADAPEHPMTTVLKDGLNAPKSGKRRGGRAARVNDGSGA